MHPESSGTGSLQSVSYPFFSGYGRDEVFPQDTDLSVYRDGAKGATHSSN